ncbi:hypothetical protein HYALB_00012994 [Hymenoscyphus albidus]|uniref:Ubiquitin 3 binding protein But2 C-terminal domain-containing protein n=1 Tax=Hymenoscyphus albidus TaxID=595503 RepID=A0A9N9LY20_9HELO|nr:hypothetical protein HYALB_00012994 [Hymenoscyphus albidus]
MKFFISLLPLAAIAAAQDTLAQDGLVPSTLVAPTGDFSLGVWNPMNSWTGKIVNAVAGGFFVGKKANTTSCPTVEGLDCSLFPGNETVLTGGNGTLFLSVAVPGGQQVYVTPSGALGYTPPHTTSKPDGSLVDGFLRYQSQTGGAPIPLSFQDRAFKACPVANEEGVFQIYSQAVGNPEDECVYVQLRTYPGSLHAWQY